MARFGLEITFRGELVRVPGFGTVLLVALRVEGAELGLGFPLGCFKSVAVHQQALGHDGGGGCVGVVEDMAVERGQLDGRVEG